MIPGWCGYCRRETLVELRGYDWLGVRVWACLDCVDDADEDVVVVATDNAD